METLFPVPSRFPEGFNYTPDFITADEESFLLDEIKKITLHTFHFQGFEAKRKVASFGYDYNFERKRLSKGNPIPVAFNGLLEKVAAYLTIPTGDFAELLVTEYPTGSVINWHRDAFPFDVVAGISLLSDCTFRLRPHDKARQERSAIISFPVHKRSLYIMRDDARIGWQHSIAPVKNIRYSITLRTLRQPDVQD